MGDLRGFLKYARQTGGKEPVADRLKHFNEFLKPLPIEELHRQGARCMDCGVPFCHTGCPLGNIIPDWNDLVSRDHWREALDRLHATNNFPEFTGRVCPAPCEAACVLGINEDPVAIKQIEMAIADHGIANGWIEPEPPLVRTGKRVAVVGSGPSGLAAAQQLNRSGHGVTVFERANRPGGLLMYGIPDFKLEKSHVWRRIRQMEAEGVEFRCNANVGVTVPTAELREKYDAILLAGGATKPRDLPIPGRDLQGIHFAMEFLPQQNARNQGDAVAGQILAGEKDVIVIGGGDTGSDCTGTSHRQGCRSLTQFELLSQPPDVGNYPRAHQRPVHTPWPLWPMILRTSTSHEEGGARHWSILTKEFHGDEQGRVKNLVTVQIEWMKDDSGRMVMRELPGSEQSWPCQLVLLAMGFLGPEKTGPIADLGLELDQRGNVKTNAEYMSSVPGVFAAGDLRRGQSLVVWAIQEGREAARAVDKHLMGVTHLPSVNAGDFAWR
ncbi:MAG TPA: glutamate synthase subunit beta [Pirellulales bacterium]|jgi:glutamate synthase (NADPH/NADH) small chain|nr:glutamate synthase subunit beta [Pirellulales bacterium]